MRKPANPAHPGACQGVGSEAEGGKWTMTRVILMMPLTQTPLVGPAVAMPCSYVATQKTKYNQRTNHAAFSTPPMRWAARCVVNLYSAGSPVGLARW